MVTQASSLSVHSNIPALGIISRINQANKGIGINLERLASGLRINRASDDVGGFVLSRRLSTQVRALSRASENVQDAMAVSNLADEALNEFVTSLQSIRDKAQEASSTSLTISERISLQNEIGDLLSELNRIASTTSFGGKRLLDGSIGSQSEFIDNIDNRLGGSISYGSNSATLLDGRSYLNIVKTQDGRAEIRSGSTAGINVGIQQQTDIATTAAQFINGAAIAAGADTLPGLTFNRATLSAGDRFEFSGVLANGTTEFSGSFVISAGTDIDGGGGIGTSLVDAIQQAIDDAEATLGIDGTGTLETTVDFDSGASTGRLEFTTDQGRAISAFNIDFTVLDAGSNQITETGIIRSNSINGEVVAVTNNAQIGNSFSSVTGSTFDTGEFEIEVQTVTAAQERIVETGIGFVIEATGAAVTAATNLNASAFNGITLSNLDTLEIEGTNADGTTFNTVLTIQGGPDGTAGNGVVQNFQDLIDELNFRNQTATSFGFNDATATLQATGELRVVDDVASTNSGTYFTLIVNGTSQTSDSATTVFEGNAEQAVISVNNGEAQTVEAGEIVTLEGSQNDDGSYSTVTFRVGNNFSTGSDSLYNVAETFSGTLNGGEAVAFKSGQQDVTFVSGPRADGAKDDYQYLTIDFDSIVPITSTSATGGETFTISSVSKEMSFFLGGLDQEEISFSLGDVRPQSLGISASRTLDDISVLNASDATEALEVIDAALEQVLSIQARAGSMTTRLTATANSLDTESYNVQSAETRITDADIAQETTDLTLNTLRLNVQAAVLAQANVLPVDFAGILLGFGD